MALVLDDRVKETSTTTGTGTYTLLGAVTGFQAFSAIGDGNTTWYLATDGTDWEVGIGTYTSAGTTLARTTIISSSNADAAVNWAAGTRTLVCTMPASKAFVASFPADNYVPRFDGTSGNLFQFSRLFVDDSGNVSSYNDANTAANVAVEGYKTRGAVVQSADGVISFVGNGFDGATYYPAASIKIEIDGSPGTADMPGRLVFSTTADAASSVTERLRISNAGGWGLAGANYGTAGQTIKSAGNAPPTWASIGGYAAMRVYTTTGNTWTKPTGLSFIVVECQGAGAGGAGSTIGTAAGSGGGAGGYARKTIAATSLGAAETIIVGTGGAGGISGGVGTVGGSSSFGTTPFLTACGGNPGLTGGGLAGVQGGSGGLSTSGDLNVQGGDGRAGFALGTAVSGAVVGAAAGGNGGASYFGGGGDGDAGGATGAGTVAQPGKAFGSGGGGGKGVSGTSASGGAGKGGVVIVWEFI